MFKLVIQDDEGKTTVVPLIRDEITIGRKEGNTIRLTERNVSRRHARIVRQNNDVQIEDLGSYNGIRVNNARIAERVSLRVSDQVQIGDYKLYLKAEGAEQVDDARTMPIERIDGGLATDAIPAMTAPTTPLSAQAATIPNLPSTPAPVRGGAATADTDPAGRPVATAAQVAALSATASYGRLVVLSSNFAGRELELSRPQMIIGRTDDNDLVINHRSISRNHAKVTRDPESGRYTIKDLESSNGIRVNGQEYKVVELRRGDQVDLGHVRMRFVEPGEDFVFARDAVTSEVAEAGGKKGMMIAIVVAVLALGGLAAFFAMKGGGGEKPSPGSAVASGAGSAQGMAGSGEGSGELGSGGAAVVAVTPVDASSPTVAPNGGSDDASRKKTECAGYKADKKWDSLDTCGRELAALGGGDDAKAFTDTARAELQNSLMFDKVNDHIREGDLTATKDAFNKIDADSVYKKPAQAAYAAALKKAIDQYKADAARLKKAKDCAGVDKLIQQAAAQGTEVADAVRSYKCEAGAATPPNTGTTTTPPPANCDAEALKDKGTDAATSENYGQAASMFEQSYRCKADPRVAQLGLLAACNMGNASKARYFYKKLSPDRSAVVMQKCVDRGISKDKLDAP